MFALSGRRIHFLRMVKSLSKNYRSASFVVSTILLVDAKDLEADRSPAVLTFFSDQSDFCTL